MRRTSGSTRAGLVGVVMLASSGSAHAAQWSIAPTLALSVDHDTNRSLATEGTPSYGTAITLDMPLQYATERLTLSLHPLVNLGRYSNPIFANSNDAIVSGAINWLTERSTWSLTGLFSDLNLTTTQLPNTGVVAAGTRRRESQAGLGWTYAQTERLSLTLQASYQNAVYSSDTNQPSTVALSNYHYTSYSLSEQLQYTEQVAGFITLSGSEFVEQAIPKPTHTYGAVAGVNWQRSERSSLIADIGASHTTLLGLTSNGLLYDLTFKRTTTTGSFSLTAFRNVSPQGIGQLTEQEGLQAALQRDLKERLSFNAGLSGIRYSGVFSLPGFVADLRGLDRTYAQANAGFSYRTTETWSVGLRGAYSWTHGKTIATADGWAVRIDAVWTPHPLSSSR